MKIRDFQELKLSVPDLKAYLTRLNIYKNKDIIFPHEETTEDSQITKDILKNSVIVLGVTFRYIKTELTIENKIFILDGHHRFKFIVDNKIDETFVKWDKEKNKCFAGFTVSGNNVGVDESITVSGEALSFLSTGIDTRVYYIKNF